MRQKQHIFQSLTRNGYGTSCVNIIISIISQLHHRTTQSESNNKDYTSENTPSIIDDNDILMKWWSYFIMSTNMGNNNTSRKEKEEDEKLHAVLQYTIKTFRRFNFDKEEIFQICEWARYFVTNRKILTNTTIHIKRRTIVTQISIKKFA